MSRPSCKRRPRGITTDEFAFVRGLTRRTPKVTMPAPSLVHFFRGDQTVDRSVYPELEAFWSDLIAIYHAELRALAALGCTSVQLDEVPCAMLCDPQVRERATSFGLDPDALVDTYIGAVNQIADRRPAGMRIALHLCRGNYKGHWMAAAAMSRSPRSCSTPRSTPSFLSTIRRAPAVSSRCAWCRTTRRSCSASSAARAPSSSRSTSYGGASTRRAVTSRWNGWRSVRNADSPAASAAIR